MLKEVELNLDNQFTIVPEVDGAQEFKEIAFDFSNPLDLVREGISNAFDARANNIKLDFHTETEYGEKVLKIIIEDDGVGMDENGLKSFFDLGNSMRRDDESAIGEKGHGTKVYFNSSKIEIDTYYLDKKYHAEMIDPNKKLFNNEIPLVTVDITKNDSEKHGTRITISGYNNNRRKKFTHAQIKDYILWFTKIGSIEKEFGINDNNGVRLLLRGVDKKDFEEISFGHIFPKESENVETLFDKYLVDAPKWYCKRYVKTGTLKNQPETEFQAVFYVEGTRVKYDYNPMIKRSGYTAPAGAYTIQERYGIWLCKDFMPIQRKNEWITYKGNEHTRFHAFVNCQELRLTANRGSIENTQPEVLQDLMDAVKEIYAEITESKDWMDIDWLEQEVVAYNTVEKEKKEFQRRIDNANRAKVANFNGIHLIEPQRESGVFTIFMQLSNYDETMFPFTVVDYDTHIGIDVIVKAKDLIPIKSSKLYYVEFKNYLSKNFNHTFENLYSIICWDISSELKNNEEVRDIGGNARTFKIISPKDSDDYTRFYLDDLRSERKIEIIALKYYLSEKYRIDFIPRNDKSVL